MERRQSVGVSCRDGQIRGTDGRNIDENDSGRECEKIHSLIFEARLSEKWY
jgi:hypothetical protein